ncbi:MAG TPA: peptidase M28, partial [Chitinophagaceae bacterium]|nr:peptidase M28 [Chitinophagaceae bacterium]
MKKLLLAAALVTSLNSLVAQTNQKDPMIVKMVNEVSKDSLESYVKKMVSFGTRNTLSTQSDPNR